jgi:hypothetical protein
MYVWQSIFRIVSVTINECDTYYHAGAKFRTTLILAPANISVPNDVFCMVHCAFNCSWTFIVHSPHVLDPPEPQR